MSDQGWCRQCQTWQDGTELRCPTCGMVLVPRMPPSAPVPVERMVENVWVTNPKKPDTEPVMAKVGENWIWVCSCKETLTAGSKGSAVSSLDEHRLTCVDCQ